MLLICSCFYLADELASIARRYSFESVFRRSISSDNNFKWKNNSRIFVNKTNDSDFQNSHSSQRTFCYLCSINQHEHQPTKPRDESQVTIFHQCLSCLMHLSFSRDANFYHIKTPKLDCLQQYSIEPYANLYHLTWFPIDLLFELVRKKIVVHELK